MLMEGEIDWVLVLGAVAVVATLAALVATVFAVTGRRRHASASGELDVVQRVAEAADKRLFETLNAIPVALVETDRQGKFVFANRAAHQLLGRRDAELLGLRFHSATWGITYPDGRPVPPDLLPSARALRGQTVKGFQHLLANPSTRRKMLVSVTAMPIVNDIGEVTGSTAAIVETEALTTPAAEPAEPSVDPRDRLGRAAFEASPAPMAVVARDGELLAVNAAALALSGATEPAERFADLFLARDDQAQARQALRGALTRGEAAAVPAVSAAGEAIVWGVEPLGAELALLTAEGAPVEAAPPPPPAAEVAPAADPALAARLAEAEAAREAAERAAAEARQELDAARRMESVGRLTGGVAHDFHALLGVMTSALDMMLKQADDPSRVRRLGQAALAAGQRGEALTRRLAAFSQGDDAAPVQTLDAGVLLRAMESRLRAQAGPGVDLMIEGPSAPAPARLDPVAFEGAVQALVANAVEAVAGQGSVAVRLERQEDGGVRLQVRDTGPGMTADVAARAVEPFFTTRAGAAGLGLAQAYAFARQAGGALAIDSAPGEGAAVSITLPPAA